MRRDNVVLKYAMKRTNGTGAWASLRPRDWNTVPFHSVRPSPVPWAMVLAEIGHLSPVPTQNFAGPDHPDVFWMTKSPNIGYITTK